MSKKCIIIGIILLIKTILSLKSTDLCHNVEQECKGNYDSNQNYQIKCQNVKCFGKNGHQCGVTKCAVNKKQCDDYTNFTYSLSLQKLKISLGKYSIQNQEQIKAHEKEKTKLIIINQKIANCPSSPYKFNTSDFCINGVFCTKIDVIPMRSGK